MKEFENLITRLNYGERAKGSLSYLGSTFILFSSLTFPDTFYPCQGLMSCSFSKMFFGQRSAVKNFGIGILLNVPTGLALSTFRNIHLQDFISMGLGCIGWVAFDQAAKKLHDSGLTKPIYRSLGISYKESSSHPRRHLNFEFSVGYASNTRWWVFKFPGKHSSKN